jgi:hypothetical protein
MENSNFEFDDTKSDFEQMESTLSRVFKNRCLSIIMGSFFVVTFVFFLLSDMASDPESWDGASVLSASWFSGLFFFNLSILLVIGLILLIFGGRKKKRERKGWPRY